MNALSRCVAIAVSIAIHVGAAGLALTGSGTAHARTPDAAIVEIDTVTLEAPPPARVDVPAPRSIDEAVVGHTHPYPVAPSHDAHTHDPTFRHAQEVSGVAPGVASAAPGVASAEPELPRFTMTLGASGAAVASTGSSTGSSGVSSSSPAPSARAPALASEADVQARLVASVPSVYPPAARSDDLEGDVSLEIVLDTDGTVTSARVLRAAGHGFDESALAAIRRYRFTSAQRQGHPIRVRMPWTVQFRIR